MKTDDLKDLPLYWESCNINAEMDRQKKKIEKESNRKYEKSAKNITCSDAL